MKPNLRSKLKYLYNTVSNKYGHFKKGVNVAHTWYGNDYGGFYVIPELVNSDSIVYSFGIGQDISFDEQLIDIHQCQVFGFDPTPKSIEWCNNRQLPQNFHFLEYGLAKNSGKVNFNLPINAKHISGSLVNQPNVSIENTVEVEMKSFKEIIKELKHSKIDIIKMDIEGTEYDVLDDILSSGGTACQILVEFHERFFNNGKERTKNAIASFKRNGFELFAISGTFQELSFVKKEFIK